MRLALTIVLLFVSIFTFAQKAGCSDSECLSTSTLEISTGYDPAKNALIAIGAIDPLWKLLNKPPTDPNTLTTGVNIPDAYSISSFQNNWNIIQGAGILSSINKNGMGEANNLFSNQPWIFRRSFCVCQNSTVTISGDFRVDDDGSINVSDANGTVLFTQKAYDPNPNPSKWQYFDKNTKFNATLTLAPGTYFVDFYMLNRSGVAAGFAVRGQITTTNGQRTISNVNNTCCPSGGVVTLQKILEKAETCNGKTDAGETAGSGWTFALKDSKNKVIQTKQTDANGQLTFGGLLAGSYTIEEQMQAGWEANTPQAGIQQVTLGANDVKFITFYNCPATIKFDPCCPPMNKTALAKLFIPSPVAPGLNQPYLLSFNNDQLFCKQSQAYLDYLKVLYPAVGNLIFNWRIFDSGTGNLPGSGPQVGSDVYTSFKPGGLGVHTMNKFFLSQLSVGRWYKIHVGMYTEPGINRVPTECSNETAIYYRIQLIGNIAKVQVSDGKKIVQESELLKSKN